MRAYKADNKLADRIFSSFMGFREKRKGALELELYSLGGFAGIVNRRKSYPDGYALITRTDKGFIGREYDTLKDAETAKGKSKKAKLYGIVRLRVIKPKELRI